MNVPQSQIAIGIPGYADAADNKLKSALVMPFKRQRNYWRRADGATSTDRIETNANIPLSHMQE